MPPAEESTFSLDEGAVLSPYDCKVIILSPSGVKSSCASHIFCVSGQLEIKTREILREASLCLDQYAVTNWINSTWSVKSNKTLGLVFLIWALSSFAAKTLHLKQVRSPKCGTRRNPKDSWIWKRNVCDFVSFQIKALTFVCWMQPDLYFRCTAAWISNQEVALAALICAVRPLESVSIRWFYSSLQCVLLFYSSIS